MKPAVSVIIPVYKTEKYLRRCVDSVLNQTFTDLEVILVDDGSPDGCPGICDAYAKIDSRVKVIHKTNGGQAEARNTGLSNATGEYVISWIVMTGSILGSARRFCSMLLLSPLSLA